MVDRGAIPCYTRHINTQEQTMNQVQTTIVAIAGAILVFGGVGGIELSETNEQLMSSAVISLLGLLACYAAYLGTRIRNDQY